MTPSIFETPHFTFWNLVYTGIGAAVFWGRTGRTKLKIYCLSHVFDLLEMPENKWRKGLEFVVFIVMGCVIGIGIAKPNTEVQALSAGFAWTGFVAKRE